MFQEILPTLQVVADSQDVPGDIADVLGKAVAAGLEQGFPLEAGTDDPEGTAVAAAGEIPQREETAHAAGQHRRGRSTCKPPMEDDDEKRVQDHVRDGTDYRHNRPQLRAFGRHVERLEAHLQHERRQAEGADAAVHHAQARGLPFRPEDPCQWFHESQQRNHEHQRQDEREADEHAEDGGGPVVVALPHRLGNQRRTAGADHQSQCPDQHHGRPDDVQRREGRCPHEIGHEKPVHDTVNAPHEHHQDARNRGDHKPPVSVVTVKSDFHKTHKDMELS